MINRLVGQFNIIGKAALSSLAPALSRLVLVMEGLIIGLLWAYLGDPVKFKDAEPVHLEDGYKDQWIKMTAVEFSQTRNEDEAQRKIVDAGVTPGMIQALIDDNQTTNPALAQQLQLLQGVAALHKPAAETQADEVNVGFMDQVLGPIACIFGALIVGVLMSLVFTFYWAVPIGKWSKAGVARAVAAGGTVGGTSSAVRDAQKQIRDEVKKQVTDYEALGEAKPVCTFNSIYVLGDDLYDDSFAIETDTGEFLGECGSGISETIGVGDPKKVAATELWLFDKNDIRTITKVLMSEHAYNDQALRSKLAPKGEAVMATPGGIIVLETQTLRVQIKVLDLQYGEGALPPRSFFERLTVQIAAWPKEGGEGGEGGGDGTPQPPDSSPAFGDTAELLNY
ncbi:MAG: hypothetical protein K8S97_11420 [Anaerolineae bacterium]|nr:hypothetical protein [Anaerolineae bacterium]